MTQKYYVPLTVIVTVENGYLDEGDLKEIAKIIRYETRWMVDEIDQLSDAITEAMPEGVELISLGVEEPIGL